MDNSLETTNLNWQSPPPSVSPNQLQLWQHLWEEVSYGIWVLDVLDEGQEFRYAAFNPAIARTSPIPVEQLLGLTVTEALPEAMAKVYRQRYSQCVRSGKSICFEERFCHSEEEVWWRLTVSPLRNPSQQIDRLVVTAIDISEFYFVDGDLGDRTTTQTALRESQQQLQLALRVAKMGVWYWDVATNLITWTAEAERVFGLEAGTFGGSLSAFLERLHPDELEPVNRALQRALDGQEVYQIEYRTIFPDGTIHWIEAQGDVLRDDGGQPISMIGVVRDVSDRKRDQKEQARLLSILEATSDFVGTADSRGQVLYMNRAAREMVGLPPEEAIAHRSLSDNHPAWVNQLMFGEALPETRRSGSWLGETAILGKDGREVPVSQLILAHHSPAGELEYFSTIARDISDRKQQENALRFIVEGTVSKTSGEFFRACVEHLVEICQVKYAFITELVDRTFSKLRMLALWTGEGFAEPYEFDVAGTPCSVVFRETWGVFPDRLRAQFPDADRLATLDCESYLGVAIVDSHGRAMGNLGILDTKPLTGNLSVAKSILQLFAARVGAEMERHAVELKLQEQEQFLRTVYEGANQPIFAIDVLPDRQFRYVGWNAAAEAASGMRSQDISGKTPEEIYGMEAGALERQRLEECLASEKSGTYEECLVFEGQKSWWVTTHNPVKDSNGKVYRLIGTTFDISHRKVAEAALRDYANRQTLLNQLVSQIHNSLDLDAVIATTIQSIRDFLDIDKCAFAWYNSDPESPIWEVVEEARLPDIASGIGSYSPTFVGPVDQLLLDLKIIRIDDVALYEEEVHRGFLNTLNCQSEILLPVRTHSQQMGVIICLHHCQVRPWTDSEVELLKAVSDQLAIAIDQAELYAESRAKSQDLQQALKELQRTQSQMVQAEKMSSLGQLVAGIAHEINNPVNFIHGNVVHARDYTQDLLDLLALYQAEYPQPSDAIAAKLEAIDLNFLCLDLRKLFSSMKVGTERIRQIVKSLRLFSRLDESEFKPVDIHDGLESTLMILQNRLKAKSGRAEIQIVKNYGTLPEVECFAGQLNQVFMNILTNAIDALEERDQGRSLAEQQQDPSTICIITKMKSPNYVYIQIIDNGIGIPSPIKEKIFDPFFTTKPVGQGTGMGMSISYQIIIEKHKGILECFSHPETGTEFAIQIPILQHPRDSYN